jgi:indole-3-glycerol phosphate synthase
MNNVLNKILETKKIEISASKVILPKSTLDDQIAQISDERDFVKAIQIKKEVNLSSVIAEIKKASPSKGIIRADFDPKEIAKSYEEGGATCLSVLTDVEYFQGSPDFIRDVKKVCKLPVLRKDFIIDPYQIYESKALGADCILLIVAALDLSQLKEFESIAHSLSMSVLIESHDEKELELALQLSTPLIGINNRNLKTFDVTLQTTIDLVAQIPAGKIPITESGIFDHRDIRLMNEHGIFTFLIGEAFMRDENPGQSLKALLQK